jgi:membrane protease YdiL (CAAX protease family)
VISQTRIFFLIAFGLSWGIGGVGLITGHWLPGFHPLATSSPLYYLAAYSVSLAGIALAARYDGLAGLRRLGRRLAPWRSSLRWYLLVVAGYGTVTVLALLAAARFRSGPTQIPSWELVLPAFVAALVKDPGPIGEEFGWRGFALPRLLDRYSPVEATVRLGVIHTAWHLPLFFIPSMPQAQVSIPLFAVGVLSIAVFDTMLYLRTGANLLLAILVHLMANVCGGLAVGAHALSWFFGVEGVAAFLVITAGGLQRSRLTPAFLDGASASPHVRAPTG